MEDVVAVARHFFSRCELLPHAVLFTLVALLVALCILWPTIVSNGDHQKTRNLPPSPPGLPVIGHLHLVGGSPHVFLRDLAARHGDDGGLMLLRFGEVRNLVVSSAQEAAEAVMRTHDHVFASRPRSAVADLLLQGATDVAFAPYGERWRQARKLVTTHLLAAHKVKSFRRARQDEDMFVAGTDTSYITLEFAVVELIRNPNVIDQTTS